MLGTIINAVAIVVGAAFGLVFGGKLSERIRELLFSVMGTFVVFLGVSMFLETNNSIVCLLSLVIGTLIGETLGLEEKIESFGGWLQAKTVALTKTGDDDAESSRARFIQAFLTTTLLYIIGPIGILGSIQDGLSGNIDLLVVKSILDGITAIVFASTMGVGTAFSAIPILLYQGLISLFAAQFQSLMSDAMIAEMTGTGGVLLGLIGISSLLQIKKIRVSTTIPAIIVAPLLTALVAYFSGAR